MITEQFTLHARTVDTPRRRAWTKLTVAGEVGEESNFADVITAAQHALIDHLGTDKVEFRATSDLDDNQPWIPYLTEPAGPSWVNRFAAAIRGALS